MRQQVQAAVLPSHPSSGVPPSSGRLPLFGIVLPLYHLPSAILENFSFKKKQAFLFLKEEQDKKI
jgi:hypothetical protein